MTITIAADNKPILVHLGLITLIVSLATFPANGDPVTDDVKAQIDVLQ